MKNHLWGPFFAGILITILGLDKITTDAPGTLWGVTVPAWTGWVYLPLGILFLSITLRAFLRGEGKEKPPIEEDIIKAKAVLEKMYIKEHGALPEYPEGRPESPEEAKDSEKREQTR